MKVKFTMSEKNKKKFERDIKELEQIIEAHGLKKINTGHYEGSGIPEKNMADLEIRMLVTEWFRTYANDLWIWFDEKNEYGEELLNEFRNTESEIQAEGFLKDCKW